LFVFDQNSRKTLKVITLMWAIFLSICLGGGIYLSNRVRQVEGERFPTLAEPCWSESEDQVAYLSRGADASTWQLWTVAAEPRMICQLEPGEWRLLGWLDNDARLLLQPRSQGVPRVTVVEVASGQQKEIRFENQGIELIGVRGGQMFFQRYEKPEKDSDGLSKSLTLLRWSPGDDRLTKIVNIPYETEKLQIEKVWPSQDGKWFALDIIMGDSGDRTLWFYNQEEDQLSWSGIRTQCLAIRSTWSPDSSGLVAAIQTKENCDLYAFWDVRSNQYTRLSSGSESHAYQPFWPREARYFLVLEKKRVYRFEPENLQATQLTAEGWERAKSRDLAVSPRGTSAAYVGPEGDDDQLYKVDFRASQTQPMLPLHSKTAQQKEWWFVMGNAFRTAVQAWTPF
jgi:hypothetical protein